MLHPIPAPASAQLPSPLVPRVDLGRPRPLRVCFPILLDGDMVMSTEHLGVGYLVAVLRAANAECVVMEAPAVGDNQALIDRIVGYEPDIVGLTLTTVGVVHATRFGTSLRQQLGSRGFLLAGGPLATHHGAKLLSTKGWEFLDGLVRGEGEIPILRLGEAIHTGSDLGTVPNLVYRLEDGVHQNPMIAALHDLDLLPDPARDQFEQHNGQLAYLRLSTSRGCTARCTFCNAPHARNRVGPGKLWRGASPKRIVDEIESLYRRYNFNTFDFVDSTFEDPGGSPKAKARIGEIAQEIINRDLKIFYNCCMQAKNWTDDDAELINLLYRSGLEKVLVGIESGSDIGLRRWNKLSTAEDNKRVIRLLSDAGVYIAFGFISFHAWSTFEEIWENLNFLRTYMGHNLRRYTTRLELYPGAEVIEQLRTAGLLTPAYDEELNPFAYGFVDPRVERLADELNRLYGDQYMEDCTIDKEPAVFEFETYDIVLHTYISRLMRLHGHTDAGRNILDASVERVRSVKQELADFNFSLVSEQVDLAERDMLQAGAIVEKRPLVEDFFQNRMDKLRAIQLRTSMQLHRAGLAVREIRYSAAAAA